jgi:hypothetical protein
MALDATGSTEKDRTEGSFMKRPLVYAFACTVAALALAAEAARTQTHHEHGAPKPVCNDPSLACALKATPAFAPDGSLWLAWMAGGRVSVARSTDLGRNFAPAVAVNPTPLDLDWGPDARPKIAVDREGRIFVAFAVFKDKAFNGEVLYSRSTDGGRSFAVPRPVTANRESQRFEDMALDPDGALFMAWLDKRNRAPARDRGEKYVGAGLAFTWSDNHGASLAETAIAVDNTCECCRLGIAFAAPGRPVVAFRNVFGGTVRDHAVITFADARTPGPVQRVSVDDWKTDVCPHQGPGLAVSSAGTYHVTWFTNGNARKGLFYARSTDGGRSFSEPIPIGRKDHNPSRAYLATAQDALWLVWKEFDGEATSVSVMLSHDDGRTWSSPKVVAQTDDASDHPLVAVSGRIAYLSWQTKREGYRLVEIKDAP